jgi:predicted CopG family antitoxin
MATITVSDEVKERLQSLKGDDESFDDLLDRLSRTEKDVEEIAASLSELDDGNLRAEMQAVHDELNESMRNQVDR